MGTLDDPGHHFRMRAKHILVTVRFAAGCGHRGVQVAPCQKPQNYGDLTRRDGKWVVKVGPAPRQLQGSGAAHLQPHTDMNSGTAQA